MGVTIHFDSFKRCLYLKSSPNSILYKNRDRCKELGGEWDTMRKRWEFSADLKVELQKMCDRINDRLREDRKVAGKKAAYTKAQKKFTLEHLPEIQKKIAELRKRGIPADIPADGYCLRCNQQALYDYDISVESYDKLVGCPKCGASWL